MMRKILFTIMYSLLWISLFADNILIVGSNTAGAEEQTTIEISIQNDDPFVAFQLEIPLPDQLEYVAGSITTDPARANGHTIAASIIDGNTLLIVAWSSNNTPMNGNSGAVASFALFTGTVPGNYGLNPQNAVIGNASSQNILTGVQSGMATILCPDIHLSTSSLNFGDVIIGNNSLRSMTIYNYGNLPLNISDITFDDPAFSVTGNTSFTVNAGNQQSVTVQFDAVNKGTYDNTMQILSDDPDEEITQIALQAYAYAVNEIHTGNMFGYSGNTATLSFSINNMEPFVGFQFDLALPSPLSFLQGSATLSDRKTDHMVAANMISANELRVVSYSPSNQIFSGNDGEVLTLTFNIQGTGGFYSLNMNEVLIADVTQGNILSDYFNGQLEVAAPDIHCNTSLNFGEVAINATDTEHLRIYNYGSDTLKITHVNISNDAFSLNTSLPTEILVGNYQDFQITFMPEVEGYDNAQLKVYSNDPDENPKTVSLNANVFIPNYFIVNDIESALADEIILTVEADNYEEFVGFQFVMSYPEFMNVDSVYLTERSQDHELITSQLSGQELLVISYSPTQMPFLGNEGDLIKLECSVLTTQAGNFPIVLNSSIMGNANAQNILYDTFDGLLTVSPIQQLNLKEGWSGISSYIAPQSNNLEQIFNAVIDDVVIIKSSTGIFWPAQNVNTIGNWNTHQGYKIKVADAVELTIAGTRENNKTLALSAGWNLIPVLSECAVDVEALFAGKDLVIVKEVAGWNLYWPEYGINTLGGLLPGKAYFVLMGSAGEIEFPECDGMKNVVVPTLTGFQTLSGLAPWSTTNPTSTTHTVALLLDSGAEDLKPGDIIGAFDLEGNCSGLALWQNEATAITLFGNDPTSETKDGFDEGEALQFKLYRPETGEAFTLDVVFDPTMPNPDPVFSTHGLSAIKELKAQPSGIDMAGDLPSVTIIPNPAREEFRLTIGDDDFSEGTLYIHAMDGRIAKTVRLTEQSALIGISELKAGVYILQIEYGNHKLNKRMVKY